MTNLSYMLIFAVIGFFWRPWLGGSFCKISRFWKLLVLAGVTLLAYYTAGIFPETEKDWACVAWVYFWLMRFWNHSHGDYFYVNDTGKDEGRSKWVDALLRLLYGKDGYYNFKGNVTGLFLGYSAPAILASLFMQNYAFAYAGASVAVLYGIIGRVLTCPEKKRVKVSEFLVGAVCFALFYIGLI